jgi:hypothetical protein
MSVASLSGDKTSVTWSDAIASLHPATNRKFEVEQLKCTGKEPPQNFKKRRRKVGSLKIRSTIDHS